MFVCVYTHSHYVCVFKRASRVCVQTNASHMCVSNTCTTVVHTGMCSYWRVYMLACIHPGTGVYTHTCIRCVLTHTDYVSVRVHVFASRLCVYRQTHHLFVYTHPRITLVLLYTHVSHVYFPTCIHAGLCTCWPVYMAFVNAGVCTYRRVTCIVIQTHALLVCIQTHTHFVFFYTH